MGSIKILVVDDDQAVREVLRRSSTFNGYTVELAEDGAEALEKIAKDRPDLTILNAMMPKLNGLDVCRRLRNEGDDLPVMILAVRDSASECVAGLDAGANDYLPKPFVLEELLVRVRSLLRRPVLEVPAMEDVAILQSEGLSLGPEAREIFHGERRISSTHTEFALLELLMSNPRRALFCIATLGDVWGYDFPTSGSALEVYTGYLCRKTEAEGEPCLIHIVRGVGYVVWEIAP